MKTRIGFKKSGLIVLSVILFFVSVAIAFSTYIYYGVVVRGILGFATVYLLLVFGKYMKIDISTDALLVASNKVKFFAFEFIGAVLSVWATMQIVEMILFLFKK